MPYYPPYVPYIPDPAAEERRTLRREGNFVGVGMLLLLLLQSVLAYAVIFLLSGLGFSVNTADTFWGLPHTLFLFVYAGIYIVMMGVPLWMAALCFGVRRNPFGMHQKVRPAVFTAAVLLGMAGTTLANLLTNTWISVWSFFGVELQNIDTFVEKSVFSLVMNLIIFAVLPALLEEMVFRGFVLQALRGMGDPAAIVISAMLFGLMHANMLQLPFAFLLGLVMGWLVVKTGNIWVAVTIHFLNNGLSMVMEYVGLFVSEEMVGMLTTLIFSLLAICGIAVLGVLIFRRSALTTPVENHRSRLELKARVGAVMGAPCMWISIVLYALMTLFLTAMDALMAAMQG